jgi:signal peptidase II
MPKRLVTLLPFIASLLLIFIVDQAIKELMIAKAMQLYAISEDVLYHSILDLYTTACIDIRLVFNYGVAFSMFAFLHSYLKWIQLLLILAALLYVVILNKRCFMAPAGIIIGAGLSNIYDRFLHGGVVDYIYWHCGFKFAIFNFADVMIDVGVAWIILLNLIPRFCANKA